MERYGITDPWERPENHGVWIYGRAVENMREWADGYIYFCHDFSPDHNANPGDYAALREPGMPEAIKEANDSVFAFGAVLKATTVKGTVVTTEGDVEVVALTKAHGRCVYVFAQGDGDSSHIDGLAVNAEISVGGQTGTKMVSELTDGIIIDHFDPYELHIYRIGG